MEWISISCLIYKLVLVYCLVYKVSSISNTYIYIYNRWWVYHRGKGKPRRAKGERESARLDVWSGCPLFNQTARTHARTKRNGFPVGVTPAPPQPPIEKPWQHENHQIVMDNHTKLDLSCFCKYVCLFRIWLFCELIGYVSVCCLFVCVSFVFALSLFCYVCVLVSFSLYCV